MKETTAERFWRQVERGTTAECWPFKGFRMEKGYGKFRLHAAKVRAHRVAWILTHGDPSPLFVLHDCDNRACCNPAHLWLGTQKDNVRDCIAKGRFPRGNLKRGARVPG